MSRMAQAIQKQVDELRRARPARARRTSVDDELDDAAGNGETDGQIEELDDATDQLAAGVPAVADTTTKGQRPMARKKKADKKARGARNQAVKKLRAAKAAPDRNPTAGVRAKPKGKILFINRAQALALVDRLLRAAVKAGDLTQDERFEADRLIARIDARS